MRFFAKLFIVFIFICLPAMNVYAEEKKEVQSETQAEAQSETQDEQKDDEKVQAKVKVPAKEEKWQLYYETEAGMRFSYDKLSIESPDKNVFRVWQRVGEKVKDEEAEQYRVHIEINCKQRTYQILSYIEKDATEGPDPKTETGNANQQKNIVPIASSLDTLYDNVCP